MENVVHQRERNTKYKIVDLYVQKNSKEIKLSSKNFKDNASFFREKIL